MKTVSPAGPSAGRVLEGKRRGEDADRPESRRDYRVLRIAERSAQYAFLGLLTLVTLAPLVWMVFTSLKPSQEVFSTFLPRHLTTEAYKSIWINMNFPRSFMNSVIVTAITLAIVLVGATMSGYAFAQLKFPGRDQLFFVFLAAMMIPAQVILIPMFVFLKRLGGLNTLWGLSFSYLGMALPFAMFLMRGFFRSLPSQLADAARIDGCTEIGIFARVFLPLARPGIATITIFQFMNTWNEFMFATTFNSRSVVRTLQPAVYQAVGQFYTDWTALTAGMTLSIVPILIVYILLQRQFISGLTAGAIKG